ncbi:hypothetical protein JD844_023432, partial [Phrynosoma platyrhinos]
MDLVVAVLLTAVLGVVVRWLLFQPRSCLEPPCISGWIPWLGAAFQFGRVPLKFIEQARLKYGPVFTVYMLGKRHTFVTEEEGFQAFCMSKDADFEQAVQQSVQHAVSVPEEIFYKNRRRLYIMLKGKLSASNLHELFGSLCHEFQNYIEDLGPEGTEELRDLVRKWSKSKQWLLKRFEKVALHEQKTNSPDGSYKTLYQHVLDTLHGKHFGPHYGLLLLWASQANAVPVAFWTLAFILSCPSIYKNIMKELESLYGKSAKEVVRVSEDDLKSLPFIKWCILETLRLRAPGAIVKKVINPIKVQNFVIPAGDLLVMSPYWYHRNPKYFPEPNVFKPDRWKEANLEKNTFLEGFMAFGGGAHQCPGRWFAIMEIHILVVLFLSKYECSLLDPLPKE